MYETENIETVGWVDVASPDFLEIVGNCIGLVYPSCSEGQSGAVVTCMKAGLIPIVSYESGVDVTDFGVQLDHCTVEEIMDAVQQLSSTDPITLSEMAVSCWQHASDYHSNSAYSTQYVKMIETILAERQVDDRQAGADRS